mmetsp:Transcript_69643/g.157462  ORF Transcript_69643/g.157462 Transcript_69643/m.157462 type:complete len:227 (-) Transcript_69643:539-1219(-)
MLPNNEATDENITNASSVSARVCLCRNQAPSAFGTNTRVIDSTSCLPSIESESTPAACTTAHRGPCAERTRSSICTTCFSSPVSQRSSTTFTPDARSDSRRASSPWPSYLILPERDASTTHFAPCSTNASAVTMPRPPRPPVTSTAPLPDQRGDTDGVGSTRTTTFPMFLPPCRVRNASTSSPRISNTFIGSGRAFLASMWPARSRSIGTSFSGSEGSSSFSECVS